MSHADNLVMLSTINITDQNAPAIHLLSLLKQLSLEGYHITLIIPAYHKALPLALDETHIDIVQTRAIKMPFIPNALSALSQLPALWRHRKVRTLYIRTSPMSWLLSSFARLFGYKNLVMEVNGWFADELKIMKFPAPLVWLYEKIQVAELRLANAVRVVTPGLKGLLERRLIAPSKIYVIGNGTDLELFQPLDPQESKVLCHLEEGVQYLVFAGNLAPWQDLTTVFKAMPLVLAKGYDVELIILGDGREKQRFMTEAEENGISDKVHFLGAKDPKTVNIYFSAADVGVAPFSKQRNDKIGLSPLKVRDYASAGLPMITSKLPGLDHLRGESWLSLAAPEDAQEVAEALISQLSSSRAEKSKAARCYAQKHYSWHSVIDDLKALL